MAAKVITVGPGTLTIGAVGSTTNLAPQCTKARLVPSTQTEDPVKVLSGDTVPGNRTETWALEVDLNLDLGETDSTTKWLFDHRGESHDFSYGPISGSTITGKLVVESPAIGGDVGKRAAESVTFPVVGSPSIA